DGQARRDRAGEGGHGEDGQSEQERVPPSTAVREWAEDRRKQRDGKAIGARDESDAGDRLVEVIGNRRQDGRNDIGVDPDHEYGGAEQDGGGHSHRVAALPSRRERSGPGGPPGLQNQWRSARRGAVGSTPMRSRQEDRCRPSREPSRRAWKRCSPPPSRGWARG